MALRPLLVLALLACALAGPAQADRATAEFVAQRADKALKARTWAEAESLYRKALEEDATLLRARLGLAEALVGKGERTAGIDELRKFLEEGAAAAESTPALTAQLARARKLLADLDALGAELARAIDAHATALVAFAGRWKKQDPAVALLALEQALRLRPEHAKATEMMASLGGRVPTVTQLFNGTDTAGWTWMVPPGWQIREGVISAKAHGLAYLARTDSLYGGAFDVRMEVRFLQQWGANPSFALCPCLKHEHDTSRFGVLSGNLTWHEVLAKGQVESVGKTPVAEVKPELDVRAWNVFEMRYRKDTIVALLNGNEVFRMPRAAGRDEGYIGLLVEDCHVEFRRVEFARR